MRAHWFMVLLISAIAFIILITGLILIHEAGHFIVARKAGVIVEEFGFGLPPRAKTLFRWRGTEFSLNWIPFGGFVRLKGENAVEESERRARGSFAGASIPVRILILVAGVAMNFLLAVLLLTIGFSRLQWLPTYSSCPELVAAVGRGEVTFRSHVLIGGVLPGSNAALAHVPAGSTVLRIDGQPVCFPQDVVTLQQGKDAVTYELLTKKDVPRSIVVPVKEGKTGVALEGAIEEFSAPVRPLTQGLLLALREARVVTVQTILGIGRLLSSLARAGVVPEGITGIIGIAQLTYTSVQEGFSVYLRLVALLSLSLAALNILPFPALDGGRMLFVLGELIFRRYNRRVELVTNTVGFGFLLFLILLVTLYDLLRLFSR